MYNISWTVSLSVTAGRLSLVIIPSVCWPCIYFWPLSLLLAVPLSLSQDPFLDSCPNSSPYHYSRLPVMTVDFVSCHICVGCQSLLLAVTGDQRLANSNRANVWSRVEFRYLSDLQRWACITVFKNLQSQFCNCKKALSLSQFRNFIKKCYSATTTPQS
jgi:hypothetical protein